MLVGQVSPVLAVGLVIEIRQAAGLWSRDQRIRRLLEPALFAGVGFALLWLFAASLTHLTGRESSISETTATYLLKAVLILLVLLPLELAFLRANYDLGAKALGRVAAPVVKSLYLHRSRKIKRLRFEIDDTRNRLRAMVERLTRTMESVDEVLADVRSLSQHFPTEEVDALLVMFQEYETYDDADQGAFDRLLQAFTESRDHRLLLRLLLIVRIGATWARRDAIGLLETCEGQLQRLEHLLAHPFEGGVDETDFKAEMAHVGHDYLFLFSSGLKATPSADPAHGAWTAV